MAAEAVLCIDCGFNRKTGKKLKTVSQRFERHWDDGNFSLTARAITCGILFVVCVTPLLVGILVEEPGGTTSLGPLGVILLTIWTFILLPLCGTFKRVIVTRDRDSRPIVIRRWWIFFLPVSNIVTDLEGYKRLRTAANSQPETSSIILIIVLFLLCGIPGLIYAVIRAGRVTVSLEIVPDHDGPPLPPVRVYRGSNELIMRQIGDTLQDIGGMHYG
jgi:hypothetical protein